MASSTVASGTVAAGGDAGGAGEDGPGPAAGDDAERQPDEQRDGGEGAGLPGDRAEHLPPGEAEGLEQRQVAAAAAHAGEQHVGQGTDGEHREHHGEGERGVPDAGVVLDVAGPLVGDGRHDAGADRAAAGREDLGDLGGRGGQVGAGPVPEQEEVVAEFAGRCTRESVVRSGVPADSTMAGSTAPVPRPVGAKLPRLNAGSTATPTIAHPVRGGQGRRW